MCAAAYSAPDQSDHPMVTNFTGKGNEICQTVDKLLLSAFISANYPQQTIVSEKLST